MSSESITEDINFNEVGREDVGKDDDILPTNKPYESTIRDKKLFDEINNEGSIALAQTIPVLTLKKMKQIPSIEHTASVSPVRYDTLAPPKECDISTLETPANRSKLFVRK